jgi:phosphoglycerate dehydrogenase-like enzyme
MKKIVLIGSFTLADAQKQRLQKLGEVKEVGEPASSAEWLKAAEGADVICSDGSFLYENLGKLKNVFVTYPYIELGAFDSEKLKKNGVFVANTRGSNRDSIVEWTMFAVLSLFRNFPPMIRPTKNPPFVRAKSLQGQNVLVVGHGNIGSQVGKLCEAFGMEVKYFERGGDLKALSQKADVVINCLNSNSSSKNLLDETFFIGMKKGAYFVSFVRHYTFDIEGLIRALDKGVLAGAAIDTDPEPNFDTQNAFYKKCLSSEKILVTPHMAAMTVQAGQNAADILVQNVEAYLGGKPQNVLTKV